MNLLIVAESISAPRYRGTDRHTPTHIKEMDDNPKLEKLWGDYIAFEAKEEYCHNLNLAKALVAEYANHSYDFEIIEIVENKEEPKVGRRFLGYDLSHYTDNSIINWFLIPEDEHACPRPIAEIMPDPHEHEHKRVILELFLLYFRPKLNENLLFPDYESARFCEKFIEAFSKSFPNYIENPDYGPFKTIGIYLVE